MDMLIVAPRGLTATVRCEGCGDLITISDRQQRRRVREQRVILCSLCRAIKVKPPTQAHYNYWLDRYSIDEIKALAATIWG